MKKENREAFSKPPIKRKWGERAHFLFLYGVKKGNVGIDVCSQSKKDNSAQMIDSPKYTCYDYLELKIY